MSLEKPFISFVGDIVILGEQLAGKDKNAIEFGPSRSTIVRSPFATFASAVSQSVRARETVSLTKHGVEQALVERKAFRRVPSLSSTAAPKLAGCAGSPEIVASPCRSTGCEDAAADAAIWTGWVRHGGRMRR